MVRLNEKFSRSKNSEIGLDREETNEIDQGGDAVHSRSDDSNGRDNL